MNSDEIVADEGEAPMLDVHPPHAPVHGVRDFLLHLFTITIGLLIALSLEAAVEGMHHRHLVHQARENIREEVRGNLENLTLDKRGLASNERMLKEYIQALNAYAKDRKQPVPEISFPWLWNGMGDSAWQTARDTGALALMPYEEVQDNSGMYAQQGSVNHAAASYIDHLAAAQMPLMIHPHVAGMSEAQLEQLTQSCALSLSDAQYLEVLTASLERDYKALLQGK